MTDIYLTISLSAHNGDDTPQNQVSRPHKTTQNISSIATGYKDGGLEITLRSARTFQFYLRQNKDGLFYSRCGVKM